MTTSPQIWHVFNGDFRGFPKTFPINFYSHIPSISQSCAFFFREEYYDYKAYHRQFVTVPEEEYPYVYQYGLKQFKRSKKKGKDMLVRVVNKFLRIIGNTSILKKDRYTPVNQVLTGGGIDTW